MAAIAGDLMTMRRWWYLVATYSGIRAFVNRACSLFYVRRARVACLHGTRVSSEKLGDLVASVHFREGPPSGRQEVCYGVVSVRQQVPELSRLLYGYLCLTSHFGLGHLEIAFYEQEDKVTFYAVRNTARSNALRLGLKRIADKLLLIPRDEELQLILEVGVLLEKQGLVIKLAKPDECVRLAVCPRLLHPAVRDQTVLALTKKYERLSEKFGQRMGSRQGDCSGV